MYDLVNHSSRTIPFEAKADIRRIALSPGNDDLLVIVDDHGAGALINFHSRKVIHRFNFKSRVRALEFSPDGEYIAVSLEDRVVQIWKAPKLFNANKNNNAASTTVKEFAPLVLHRKFAGHNDDVTCFGWSPDSRYFCTGSKDSTVRVYSLNKEDNLGFEAITLTGHKERVVACFFRYQDLPSSSSSDAVSFFTMADTQKCPVIYTLSKDGTLFLWKWKWNDPNERVPCDPVKGIPSNKSLSVKEGTWELHSKQYIEPDASSVQSASMRPSPHSDLLLVGYSNGSFSLFETPSVSKLQTLSVSQNKIGTAVISPSGEWLALASAELGQLLVWEWSSETYILKQQGHFYDLNAVAYSSDGQLIATGGDDNKVKVWSTLSGFCFVTFTDHEAPVTALSFLNDGNAVLSASMDGTVRAFDLVRYKNFRTMVTPSPTQLTCLAIDGGGEVVCAGGIDPPSIYVWSLQTGRLLDTLAGHEGPISSLTFSQARPLLASVSWDKTLRLWEPYRSVAPVETFDLTADALSVAFRPDGREVCASSLDGRLTFFEVDSGKETGFIEGRRDISTSKQAMDQRGRYFSTICYSADGSCILAGGRSKYVCLYEVSQKILVKQYQISHNRSLVGVNNKNFNKELPYVPGSATQAIDDLDLSGEDSETEEIGRGLKGKGNLPGAKRGADKGKRNTKPEVRVKWLQFSPTGQAWAAATTEGLVIFSLDSAQMFDPVSLDENVTPESTRKTAKSGNYGKALLMALHLSEQYLIKEVFHSVPSDEVTLVARSVPIVYIPKLLEIISECFEQGKNLEHLLVWVHAILSTHSDHLRSASAVSSQYMQSFRQLQKMITVHEKELTDLCEGNLYTLDYMCTMMTSKSKKIKEEDANIKDEEA